MSIEAFCPNGHRILCPDDSLGRAARCPKCGTPFRIGAPQTAAVAAPGVASSSPPPAPETPAATEAENPFGAFSAFSAPALAEHGLNGASPAAEPEAPPSDAAEHPVSASGSNIVSGSKVGSGSKITSNGSSKQTAAEPKPGTIAFLCPNGHKLNGPEKLAGRLGQCPHCNTKFQIPPLDVIRAAQASPETDNLAGLEEVQFSDTDENPPSAAEEPASPAEEAPAENDGASELAQMLASLHVEQSTTHARPASGINILGSAINKVAAKLTGGVGSNVGTTSYQVGSNQQYAAPQHHAEPTVHPLADMMLRLWAEREHGGIIELHLEGGNVLLPDWFEQRLSANSHGLFASQAADGTVTMTVVPWDSVERVVIRGVVGLPDGMFE
jgi:hypothetical protein